MTIKELLLHEIETLPEILVEEMLDYVQYLKKQNLQASSLPDGHLDIVDQVAGIWKDRKFSVEKYDRKNSKLKLSGEYFFSAEDNK